VIAVSDTGPLIALAKVSQLNLLQAIFREVHIPPIVHHELLAKYGPEAPRLESALQGFLKPAPSPTLVPAVVTATVRLHPGEQEAVALAYEREALLLIDDRLGRTAARQLGLAVTGVIGVLIQAKQMGFLPLVGPVLVDMRQRGYWLSDELLAVGVRLAGETLS
jgi:predicted nucleic acid-binding protein